MQKAVKGNQLTELDAETNAQVPVFQQYEEGLGKEVQGNRLVVRDEETNAIVPVVKVLGKMTSIFVEKLGINSLIYPKYFCYDKDLTVSKVILSGNAAGASFSVDGTDYDDEELLGVTVPAGVDLIISDIDIKAGCDTGSITIIF
ncbi:MAG: hypothetical protein LBM08_03825 [Dysgonamonadaceae bacterium]|jgi:hypothetical protein|nr:hypothetical protein [Dysgonamonadaceae bacterium]